MSTTEKFTSADLAAMPDNGMRYEIIEGELYVSKQPGYEHQFVCGQYFRFLQDWSDETGIGAAFTAPGLIFAEDDDVAPDVIWMSHKRIEDGADKVGHFHIAPELVIEVLSPGKSNERRDREDKLDLYSRRGVQEYWITDWIGRRVEIYRRQQSKLKLTATLYNQDTLESPLLPGFSCPVAKLFFTRPSLNQS